MNVCYYDPNVFNYRIANKVSKSRSEIANKIRLLKLPKIIHIAGTNGKGSVAKMIAKILMKLSN